MRSQCIALLRKIDKLLQDSVLQLVMLFCARIAPAIESFVSAEGPGAPQELIDLLPNRGAYQRLLLVR